jgi:phospholipid-binding lipoprotein MlaA
VILPRRILCAAVLCAALLQAACASRDFSLHSLPAETPASDNAIAIQRGQAALAQIQAAAAAAANAPGTALTPVDVPPLQTYDPWERMNRMTYRFNARFDEHVFLPVANGYRRLPQPVRTGVSDFFSNLSEVVSVVNYVVQLRPAPGVRSLGRFVINSTLGIGGLFDVATRFHIPSAPTGFGPTLARWGVHPGPYLVLPILGPSTVRDGFGFLVDYGTAYAIDVAHLYRGDVAWALTPLNAVDQRSNTSFRYYASGSPFEYDTIRFLYVRKALLEDDALRLWRRPVSPDRQAPAGR